MYESKVYDKLVNFAMQEISFAEFQEMLFASTKEEPVRVAWETLEGNNRYYWMYWDNAAYVGGEAGGSATKEEEGMVNIQVKDKVGDWRTLDYSSVSKIRFKNQTFKVK
jgi:hypothetical protein